MKCIQSLIESTVMSYTTIAGRSFIQPNADGEIRWHIVNFTPDMDKYKVILAFENAFAYWQQHFCPVRIMSTGDIGTAHITLRFRSNGDDDLPMDFTPGVLAYGYAPYGGQMAGRIYFNDAHQWGEMHSEENIDLRKVAVHEIGHTLNIGHTDALGDIMQPYYSGADTINITQDSIDAIRFLYGHLLGDTKMDIIRRLYPDTKSVLKLNEIYLVALANELGIDATARDLKRDTQARIFNVLGYAI